MADDAAIARVREFNRTVTQRIGVLDEEYLARGRPLGASRVLWEIDAKGSDARVIRNRLDLDSGYLSRIFRMLEREGLVQVEPARGDQRRRLVRLTRKGKAERKLLDRSSDDLAWSLLEPLDEARRVELVAAMETVTRLLNASQVELVVEDPNSANARFCLASYFAELNERFDAGFDPSAPSSVDVYSLVEPAGAFLVAYLHGTPIGCGAVKFDAGAPAYIKRMWVAPVGRGIGLGRRMLSALEDRARNHGASAVQLETNRTLAEAINLYRSAGYQEVAPFNDERYAHHWFEKNL
jgi:DNA-binding MarR family transcriptional regulator